VAAGNKYLRSYDLAEKVIVENESSIVGAKHEREHNFTNIAYCRNSSTLIAIAIPNNIFIIENGVLK